MQNILMLMQHFLRCLVRHAGACIAGRCRCAVSLRASHGTQVLEADYQLLQVFEDIWIFTSQLKIASGYWAKVEVDHTRSPGPGRRFYHSSTFYPSTEAESNGRNTNSTRATVVTVR